MANLPAPLATPGDFASGPMLTRLRAISDAPLLRRTLPWFLGAAALGGVALTWSVMTPAPQRLLYAQIDDSERAGIVAALDKGGIHYKIDNGTGALTVDEGDVYKARMLVAQNGALASPDTGTDMLDKLPLGASRTMEGARLLAAKQHELMLTIKEIDGVEAVRVNLAEGEKSVFVRDSVAPSASVMLKLADGRQLSASQVSAIVNLVASSVPGLTIDAVKVVDQHGHLLTDKADATSDRLEMEARLEDKLRGQIAQLLTPMLGDGNFTSEVQVDLDMDQVTSARESYDKQGVLRSETQATSQTSAAASVGGVPGVTSNTPPPQTTASPGAPKGTPIAAASPPPGNGESSATRSYELGREVAVSNQTPGRIKRLSVAVALSDGAKKKLRPADIDQIKQLVSATVGADPARGDQVAVVARGFDTTAFTAPPFYEASWFAMALRSGVALVAVLLVLLLGVRPLAKALKREPGAVRAHEPALLAQGAGGAGQPAGQGHIASPPPMLPATAAGLTDPRTGAIHPDLLGRHVGFAQALVEEHPENAVLALRQMLKPNEDEG